VVSAQVTSAPGTSTTQSQSWEDYLYPPDIAIGTVTTGTSPSPYQSPTASRSTAPRIPETISQSKAPKTEVELTPARVHDGDMFSVTRTPPGSANIPESTPDPDKINFDRQRPDENSTQDNSASDAWWLGSSITSFPATRTPFTTPTTFNIVTKTPPAQPGGFSNVSSNATMTSPWESALPSICRADELKKAPTSYSIVYTSTLTWTGDPLSFTPFPPETTPESSCVDPLTPTPVRMTLSRCQRTGPLPEQTVCETTTSTTLLEYTETAAPFLEPVRSMAPTTVLVTAKHPTVVYSPISTPQYDQSGPGQKPQGPQGQHDQPTGPGAIKTPDYRDDSVPSPTPITLVVRPGGVGIGDQWFSDAPQMPTQTVTVGGNPFVINPSEIIGAGQTINRPAAVGGVWVPTPTTTNMGGLAVTVSGSVAVIDGTTFNIPMTASSAIVKGQTVSLGPNGVAIASQTVPITVVPLPTEVFIAGGELVTAIGPSLFVMGGKTITYGGGSSVVTDVDGDTITIGPEGVTMHGSTIGGDGVKTGDSRFEIVGGATVTEIGASVAVINGVTYTVGPGTGTTTTVIGGETITISPSGVVISTLTLKYPFGPTMVITPTPGATVAAATANPTSSKDAGQAVRPDWALGFFFTCIAIGVRIFGFLL
jgi:hypothetical protein